MPRLTSAQIEWTMLAPLTDLLPYQFDNGAKFKGFRAECDSCNHQIELEEIRGQLTPLVGNRCVLIARARCSNCGEYCYYQYLLNAGGGLVALPLSVDDHPILLSH